MADTPRGMKFIVTEAAASEIQRSYASDAPTIMAYEYTAESAWGNKLTMVRVEPDEIVSVGDVLYVTVEFEEGERDG